MSPALSLLFIAWQEPESRRFFPVARLLRLPSGAYELAYLRASAEAVGQGFRGLPGFEDLGRAYLGAELPALFEHRLPVRGRRVSAERGPVPANDSLDAAPITLLVPRGDGPSERLEVFAPALPLSPGTYYGVFTARGVGRVPGTAEAVATLVPRQPLLLHAEPDNAYNPRALRLLRADGAPVGYVPDYLANELAAAGGRAEQLSVEVLDATRVSFAPALPVYSLQCRYTCGAELGRALFRSDTYKTAASHDAYDRTTTRVERRER